MSILRNLWESRVNFAGTATAALGTGAVTSALQGAFGVSALCALSAAVTGGYTYIKAGLHP